MSFSLVPLTSLQEYSEKKVSAITTIDINSTIKPFESEPLLEEIIVESNEPSEGILNTQKKEANYILNKHDIELFQNFLDEEKQKYVVIDNVSKSLKVFAKKMTMASVVNRISFMLAFTSFFTIYFIHLASVDTKSPLVTFISPMFGGISIAALIVKCYSRTVFKNKKRSIASELNQRLIKIHQVQSSRSWCLRCIGWDGTGCEPPTIVDLDGSISRSGVYVPYDRALDYHCGMPTEGPKSIYDFSRFNSHYTKVLKAYDLLESFKKEDFGKVNLFIHQHKIPIHFKDYKNFLEPVWQYDGFTPEQIEEIKRKRSEDPQTSICDVAYQYFRYKEMCDFSIMPPALLEIIFEYQSGDEIPESKIV